MALQPIPQTGDAASVTADIVNDQSKDIRYTYSGAGPANRLNEDLRGVHLGDPNVNGFPTPETFNLRFNDSQNRPATVYNLTLKINATDNGNPDSPDPNFRNTEIMVFIINGVRVNLNDLIRNGELVPVGSLGWTGISAQGDMIGIFDSRVSGLNFPPSDTWEFKLPISTLSIQHNGASNGSILSFYADPSNVAVPCFVSGTMIDTVKGKIKVENLKVGDLVLNHKGIARPILWIGSRKVGADLLARHENLRPIKIEAGALGDNLPETDLFVSRQHRIVITSEESDGVKKFLVPAIRLTVLPGISICDELPEVTYWHVLLAEHDVIYANGLEAESLYLGEQSLFALPLASVNEIKQIAPYAFDPNYEATPVLPFASRAKDVQKLLHSIAAL